MKQQLLHFPMFALGILIGIVQAITSDVEVFLLFVWGILLGILFSPLAGVVIALGLYLIFRMAMKITNGVIQSRNTRHG